MRPLPLLVPAALLLAALALPSGAQAHVDLCTQGACLYAWEWNWGGGSCVEGKPYWWSYRTVRASAERDDVTHTVEVRNDCHASGDPSGSGWGSSSLSVHYTTYNETSRTWTYAWLDWSGTESEGEVSCSTRYWGAGNEHVPNGSTVLPCPAGRPPPVVIPLP